MSLRSGALGFAMLAASAAGAGAQVGHEPNRSPYRDLEKRHELTVNSGLFRAHPDAAGVAPRSGVMVGLRYQWLAGGGPVNLNAELSRVESERRVLDPDLPGCTTGDPLDCKLVSMYRWPLYFADFGLSLNLTGGRSYRNLVPEVRGGLGLASDFHTKADIGNFTFGTKVLITWGGGIRWVGSSPLQLRFDLANRLYKVGYPTTYYQAAPDSSSVVTFLTKRSAWMNNAGLTIGVSYIFGK